MRSLSVNLSPFSLSLSIFFWDTTNLKSTMSLTGRLKVDIRGNHVCPVFGKANIMMFKVRHVP